MVSGFLFGVVFVLLGLGVLYLFDRIFKWNLKFFTEHPANLQAWIYILQTVLLFGTLFYFGKQTEALKKTIKANTVQLLMSEQREVLGKTIEHPALYDALIGQDIPKDGGSRIYLSMVFNHGFNAFSLRKEGYIEDDWWAAITRDMQDVMRKGAMRKRWAEIRQDYPSSYQNFIDHCILSDQRRCSNAKAEDVHCLARWYQSVCAGAYLGLVGTSGSCN
jgi:hypothetical protein